MTDVALAQPTRRTVLRAVTALGVFTAVWCSLGIGARATYNTRTTADEPQYLLSAISIFEDGDLDVSDERAAGRFLDFHEVDLPRQETQRADGRAVSPHDPLLPVLLAVPVGLGGWIGAKVFLALVAGLLAAVTLWTAVVRFGLGLRTAIVAVSATSLAAPLAVYGTQVYPEIAAALAVTVAIACVTGPLGRRGIITLLTAVVALPWLSVKYAPVALALTAVAGWRLLRESRRRAVAGSSIALALAALVYGAVHQAIYGGLTPYAAGSHFGGGELTVAGSDPNLLGRTRRLLGLLVDREFGLVAWAPVFLLAVPAVAALIRLCPRRRERPSMSAGADRAQPDDLERVASPLDPLARVRALALVAPLAAGWANATWVALTMHGWWWPGRQVVVIVPCLALALAVWTAEPGAHRARMMRVESLGMLGLAAFVWQIAEVLTGHHTLIVDFARTDFAPYRLWRRTLPDFRRSSAATPWLALTWTTALVTLGVTSSRLTGHRRCERSQTHAPPASAPPPSAHVPAPLSQSPWRIHS